MAVATPPAARVISDRPPPGHDDFAPSPRPNEGTAMPKNRPTFSPFWMMEDFFRALGLYGDRRSSEPTPAPSDSVVPPLERPTTPTGGSGVMPPRGSPVVKSSPETEVLNTSIGAVYVLPQPPAGMLLVVVQSGDQSTVHIGTPEDLRKAGKDHVTV